MDDFVNADEADKLSVVVTGKQKWQVSLVVPAEFSDAKQYTLPRISQEKGKVQWSLSTKQYQLQ